MDYSSSHNDNFEPRQVQSKQLHQRSAANTVLTSQQSIPAPCRCFFSDINSFVNTELQARACGKLPRQLRLLGVIVAVESIDLDADDGNSGSSKNCDCQQGEATHQLRTVNDHNFVNDCTAYYNLHLDDGTGIVAIKTEKQMIDSINYSLGDHVECLCSLHKQYGLVDLVAVMICRIDDPQIPTLRMLEILLQRKREKEASTLSSNTTSVLTENYYPSCIGHKLCSSDVFGLVLSMKHIGGISKDEIKAVHRQHAHLKQIDDMIVELQLSGQIYENTQKKFLPL